MLAGHGSLEGIRGHTGAICVTEPDHSGKLELPR